MTPPQIIYEDKNLLVINKPSGLITHPKDATDKQESVTGWLVEKYPSLCEKSQSINYYLDKQKL